MRKILVFAAVLALLIAVPTFAVTRTWKGATSANWSEPTNWSPAGVPNVSDTLVLLAGSAQNRDMTNDLPPGTRIGPISMPEVNTFSLAGNSLVLTGDITGYSYVRWDVDLKFEADVTLPGTAFNGMLDVNGHSVALLVLPSQQFNAPRVQINGLIVGNGILQVYGVPSKITTASAFGGTIRVSRDCEVAASMPDANFVIDQYALLAGEGTIGSVSGPGDVSPGVYQFGGGTIRTLRTKSLSLGGYQIDINYFVPFSDKLEVTGTVTLSGSLYPALRIPLRPPTPGAQVVIIDNDGTDPVIGTFQDLPEGAPISADGFTMRISYHGGDGNDVTLTNIAYGKIWTGGCHTGKWSDACNWSPASVPASGELLDFGSHPSSTFPIINDLPAGFVVGGLTLNDYWIDGNPITLVGDVSTGPLGAQLSMPITIGASAHIRCPYLDTINVNGNTLTIEGLTAIGELNGSGTIPPAFLQVGGGTFAGTLSGTLFLGSLPHTNVAGVTHLNSNIFDAKLADVSIDAGGVISPGPADGSVFPPSTMGTISATSLSLAGTYDCDLYADTVDTIIVTGPVSLSGPLNIVVRKAGQTAPFFKIVDNRGSAPVSGTFSGLPEGATVQASGSTFTITYRGGDGNDVVLVSEPPPTVALSQSAVETVFGESFTMRTSVSGRGSAVTFTDGLVLLGSVTPTSGVVTMDVANLGVGTHLITAAFGVANATMTHSVKRGSTGLVVTGSVGAGQVVAVTAIVRPVAPAAGGPTGIVTIEVDGARIGAAPLAGGTATIPTLPLSPGRHTIAAHYAGDSSFESGNGSSDVVIAPPRGRSVRH